MSNYNLSNILCKVLFVITFALSLVLGGASNTVIEKMNLILAIISSSLVSITMRLGEGKVKNNISMLSVNYFICMILSVVYTGAGNLFQTGEGFSTAIGLGVINGFFYIASLILFQNSVKKNGVVLSSIFMKLGIMMPLIISILLFGEMPTMVQIIGFVIAVTAIVIINMKEKEENVLRRFVMPGLALCGSVFMVIACIFSHGWGCLWYLIVFAVFMLAGHLLYKRK